MQPMAAGVRRSLHNPNPHGGAAPSASAHWPRDEPLAALTPSTSGPQTGRREVGLPDALRARDGAAGTPLEVRCFGHHPPDEHGTSCLRSRSLSVGLRWLHTC